MKYIRTKDGIMKVDDYLEECEKWQNIKYLTTKEKFLQGTQQADTIDELVDEAVFFDDNGKPHYMSQEGNIWFLGAALFKDSLRFGIFTETGLIYVAKMVDKDVVLI